MNGLGTQQLIQLINTRTIELKKPTQEHFAIAFGKDVRTIRRWQKPQKYRKLGRKTKIRGYDLQNLYPSIQQAVSQQEMANVLYQQTGIRVNQSTISRTFKKYGITYKKAAKQFSEQDLEKAKQFITDNYSLLSLPTFYALDECGFNLGEVPRYGYAHKDNRVVIKRPGKRGSNYTLILLIQNVKDKGVIHWKLIKGGAKSEDFHDFLAEINFPTDKENYLLLDNTKTHHANQACKKKGRLPIKELAELKKIILKYLVAYSPQLNPVELCFNFIRQHIEKCQARTEEKLKLAIEEAIVLLQEQDLTEYFRHCWNYFSEEIRPNKRRKPVNWSKIFEVKIPWGRCQKIYPSEKWKGLGTGIGAILTRNTQKLVSVQKRTRENVLKSWKLANPKSVKLSI